MSLRSFLLLLPVSVGAIASTGHIGQPSSYQSPRLRWWWPGGWIEPSQVTSEMTEMIDAGFGGGEIGDVPDSVTVSMDPEIYGWAQDRWNAGILAAFSQADKLGGYVDLNLGPHWPTGFPGYTPDSPETMKELVHGQAYVEGGKTFTGTLPLPEKAPSGNGTANNVTATPTLVAVLVAQVTEGVNSSAVTFDSSSVEVITDAVSSNETITWTAPSNGTYILVAVYGRGTGQVQNLWDTNPTGTALTYPSPAYVVDHFSRAGVEAGIKYWDEHILTSELQSYLLKSDGSVFEDSLELKFTQYWTLNFTEEFVARRGYDLIPFLLYVLKDVTTFNGDSTVSKQIINDFYQTVTDLYTDYRLGGLKQWANSLGLKLRVQPYTASFDSAYAASVVDIPEGESLGFQGDDDAFRVLAAGRDIGGKTTILSDELGAFYGTAYGITWKTLLGAANHDFGIGVSQVVIHGFPYTTSPTSQWPGFGPFSPFNGTSNGFSDLWGPRQPQWLHARNTSAYLANSQLLLQSGGAAVDVAILNQAWGVTATWQDAGLNAAGFSYQFPSAQLLTKHNVRVENARLAPNGPNYKALVINSTAIGTSAAQLLLSYGQAGLPVVVVEPIPQTTFSYTSNIAADAESISELFSQLTALETTKTVSNGSGVPDALAALGVEPSVRYPPTDRGGLVTYRRALDSEYLYWVYNNGNCKFSGAIEFEGTGQPNLVNLWTGDVSPVAAFSASGSRVSMNVTVNPSEAVAIYLGSTNPFGAAVLEDHFTATDCTAAYVRDGCVLLASNNLCSGTTTNGSILNLTPSVDLPATVSPSNWTLAVQDWAPAVLNETGVDSANTTKTDLDPIVLSELVSWPNIDSLASASGIGVYTSTVALTEPDSSVRVLLDLGAVEGSWGIRINGQSVIGVNWMSSAPLDITDLVVNGDNDIEITVATTLWNKLIEVWPAVYGSSVREDVGLIGPVTFSYVSEVGMCN